MIEIFVGVFLLETITVIVAVVVPAAGGIAASAASSIVVATASSIYVVVFAITAVGRTGVVSALTATVVVVTATLKASLFLLDDFLEGMAPVFGVLATMNWAWLEQAIRLVTIIIGAIVVGAIVVV
eukprot:11863026-Ditylum_brightwellii.AAC.1